jgi:anti-sigma B factor antagonist
MAITQLEASVRQQSGVPIIDLYGDIDGNAERVLMDAYAEAEREDSAAILLNFAKVAYINSKGIALIVVLLRRAVKSGHRLFISSLRDHFREIFEITRLSDYMPICTDEESALAEILASDKVAQPA